MRLAKYCKYCGYRVYYWEEKVTGECDECYWGDYYWYDDFWEDDFF